MKKINLVLIGCGRHSKRIYLPLIKKYQKNFRINLKAVIDIDDKKNLVEEYLNDFKFDCKKLFLKDYKLKNDYTLKKSQIYEINSFIKNMDIDSVIISTDPNSHKAYSLWALDNELNILIDKPICARNNASFDIKEAKKILSDFEEIEELYYIKKKQKKELIFSCMAQRRYHPAMIRIKKEIKNGFFATNCPISSITMLHSDGQWRMPNEILYEKYHGFNEGIGKCSHSGYHFFDIISWFLDDDLGKNKKYDQITIFSNFVRPMDFLSQINYSDYNNLFGEEFRNSHNKKTFDKISNDKRLGEIDAFINYCFLSKGKKLTSVNLSLVHNGFSTRNWFYPKKDLYKGNGRVRHESYIIEQGPFQSIHYHSYQSEQILSKKKKKKSIAGDEFHSEVLIFRNSKFFKNSKSFERIDFGSISPNDLKGYSRGHQEEARGNCFVEFFEAIQGIIEPLEMISTIEKHKRGVSLMSGAYMSACKELEGKNPLIKLEYKK